MSYVQDYVNLSKNNRQFQAVTSMSIEVFAYLHKFFEVDLEEYSKHFTMDGSPRQRKVSKRLDGVLAQSEDKLYFLLSYLKNNSLQETHASNWGISQPQCNLWIHFY